MQYEIKDIGLASEGKLRIYWADNQMPVLSLIRKKFKKEKPLKGKKISCCLHVTTETANLVRTLKDGGAEVVLCASNPLSTQDDVAAAMVKNYKIPVFAIKGEANAIYYRHINKAIDFLPNIVLDDGADLISTLHAKRKKAALEVIAGTEETTTGVIRLRSLEEKRKLLFPIIAVNDANTKHLFDNRYGTGQSTLDGIIRATNVLIAGKRVVVCGYGMCGRGVAMRAKGLGADVIITEIEPLRALEALMDGYRVMTLMEAAKIGDIFVTVTGDINVLRKEHFQLLRDGCILANSGHFNVEIDLPALKSLSVRRKRIRPFLDEFLFKNGRRIYLIAEGRLVNLAAAEGHPALVMDMSFANQALSVEYIARNGERLEKKVYKVPQEIDSKIAQLKLSSIGIKIDKLTSEQRKYLKSWEWGT